MVGCVVAIINPLPAAEQIQAATKQFRSLKAPLIVEFVQDPKYFCLHMGSIADSFYVQIDAICFSLFAICRAPFSIYEPDRQASLL